MNSERFSGTWNGKEVSPKRDWGGHHFTDEECKKLLNGETIEFSAVSKAGKSYTAKGALAEQEFNGKTFVGFKADFGDSSTAKVPDEWCQHKFTEDEKMILESGVELECHDFVSKKGKTFSAKIRWGEEGGRKKIIPNF